ncbi:MAG TPA: bifunctional diaminohydroxyphosphoribosylaminopyrimidine deaminase/5-amino-6-(5-phosphoribosylamino)uracil reductase RibD [Saprospiraceae bacterium]|nr:bifunctional diaminohydroxyphosphoribosylaminopyrimidine deaminase/5-amino-6-(5-phosphoribosylamino)uracil reductase RibD [Saprospiraceae bacterium]
MREEHFVRRCFDLARQGSGQVSPNPMVGAVLVHEGRIIGEGFHREYGTAHAEVNAINSVEAEDQQYIAASTLYVSLEPCCIQGNTPPCTDLIISSKIPKVVISALDQTEAVRGKGVQQLREAGIQVSTGLLEAEGEYLAAARNTFVREQRPYIILKYATSQNQLFAPLPARQLWLSNNYSKRLVHRWRMETDAILVGTNTAITDDPSLTNRLYFGRSPIRVVLDRELALPKSARLFDQRSKTIIFTRKEAEDQSIPSVQYIQIDFREELTQQIVSKLAQQNITSLLIEGGAMTLESFIEANLWDEARVFKTAKWIDKGIPAPKLDLPPKATFAIGNDKLELYENR